MSSTQNSNLPKTFEDFQPLVETKETPDSRLLLVHLPGFARQHVGANYEAAHRRVRVFGERPLDDINWKRFNVEYIVPETYDGDTVKGKFEDGAIITITMPKKPIPSVTPKEEPKPAQEAAKQVTPPESTPEVEAEGAITKSEKDISQEQLKSEMESQRESEEETDETPTPPEAIRESKMAQKDQEEIPQKDTKDDEKHRDETKEAEDSSTPRKATGESGMPQKDQEGIPQEGTLDGKTSETGKAPQKDQSMAAEETKEESKESAVVAESSGLKTAEKGEKKMDIKTRKDDEWNYGKRISESPIGKGIKDMANSASQAVTRLANRFSEEDKQKLIYVGAAILAVAVGVYASFKLRSVARQ